MVRRRAGSTTLKRTIESDRGSGASHSVMRVTTPRFDWLKSPAAFAPGTKMTFAGLSDPKDRANVIAYLKQQGGGPDFPAPAAPAAGAAKSDEAGAKTANAGPAASVEGGEANPVKEAGGAGQPQPVAGKASSAGSAGSQTH